VFSTRGSFGLKLGYCLPGLLLHLEDGGTIFLRNISELLPDYTPSHLRTH
jgi:hypothetical protein